MQPGRDHSPRRQRAGIHRRFTAHLESPKFRSNGSVKRSWTTWPQGTGDARKPYNRLMPVATPESPHAAIGAALADVPGVSFAIVFGSSARGTAHARSDVDVALGFGPGRRPGAYELGAIVSRLEEAAGQRVDVVVLDDAPPGLAYRVFRDGVAVLVRDRSALVERKARAIIEYLDYRPVEEASSTAVLARRSR